MKKRGQIGSEAFAYMLTIIIVGVILIIGYWHISSGKNVMDKGELLQFQNKLEFDIQSVGSEYGTYRKITYFVPQNVEEICFVDLGKKDRVLSSKILGFYPIIEDILQSNLSKNLFYIGSDGWSSVYVKDLSMDHYPFMNCFQPKNKKMDIVLEGKGGNEARIVAEFITRAKLGQDTDAVLHSADEIITLKIPKGTQPSDGEITIEVVEPTIAAAQKGASDLYRFSPSGIKFSNPAELSVKYNPAVVGQCPNGLNFYIFSEEGDQKESVLSKRIDCENKVAFFNITGFG